LPFVVIMSGKAVSVTAGILVIFSIAGYFVAGALIRKKVDAALRALPPSMQITYASLHSNVFTGYLVLDGLHIRVSQGAHAHEIDIGRVSLRGIRWWSLLKSHRLLMRNLRMEGCTVSLDDYLLKKDISFAWPEPPFSDALIERVECADLTATTRGKDLRMAGSFELDSVSGSIGNFRIGGVRFLIGHARYAVPGTDETVFLTNMDLDSKKRLFQLDTLRVVPSIDKIAIGRSKGHQVDVVEATSEGITAEGLDVIGLQEHRLTADKIAIRRNHIYVFRDRRLPLEPGEKALPMESLKAMSVRLRVKKVAFGPTTFSYEEFPKKGDKTGTLKIFRLTGTLEPLINKPEAGDPAYITLSTEGSLMNSGSVTATTRMPLHKGDAYEVEGAFHELDVTKLNDPAENLGGLHLESGLLNSLTFRFDMNEEKATGKIVGEYHGLVVDKLKGSSDDKKVDKLKSFALKKFIIPRDKDNSLPEKKRTGTVDYKRDPQRYFSYYLLHSLLVGVKSSFSLGFLLPG
jgi:hypothetical protein